MFDFLSRVQELIDKAQALSTAPIIHEGGDEDAYTEALYEKYNRLGFRLP